MIKMKIAIIENYPNRSIYIEDLIGRPYGKYLDVIRKYFKLQ
ncbi:MAG: hypothetical protein ABIC91_08700 [Nanoarchaeota archaeon]